jgi:hypothetical protein
LYILKLSYFFVDTSVLLHACCFDLMDLNSFQQGPNSFVEASNMPVKTLLISGLSSFFFAVTGLSSFNIQPY